MKLPEYRKEFADYSAKASDLCRQLAFAGIAVVWIFAVGKDDGRRIAADLILPCLLLVGTLAADFLQYVAASLVWFLYYRHMEKKGHTDAEDLPWHHESLTWPPFVFFGLKIVLVIVGYCLLLRAMVTRLLS